MMLVQKPPLFPTTSSTHNHHHRPHHHSSQQQQQQQHYHHKRHPSAPLLVQPTGKPGLLSLSMAKPSTQHSSSHPLPQQQSQQQQQQQQQQQPQQRSSNHHRSPKNKPAAAAQQRTSPKPAHAEAQPPQQQVGVLKTAKDKIIRRSTSPTTTTHTRRPRQPSPSTIPSQPTHQKSTSSSKPRSTTLFDPFIVHSDSDSDNHPSRLTSTPAPPPPPVNINLKLKTSGPAGGEVRPTPKLTDPSGKLAKRRRRPSVHQAQQVQGTPTPAPSKAVAVPRYHTIAQRGTIDSTVGKYNYYNDGTNNNVGSRSHTRAHSALLSLSRSAPSVSSPSLTTAAGAFPICDDTDTTTEDGNSDDENEGGVTPPATPIRPRPTYREPTKGYDDGPKTAPLSSTYRSGSGYGFPFGGPTTATSTITPSPAQRYHQSYQSVSGPPGVVRTAGAGHVRAPSEGAEGVFSLSFDEDSSNSSSSSEEWSGLGLGLGAVGGGMEKEKEKLKMKMLFGLTPRKMQELRFGSGHGGQRKDKGKMREKGKGPFKDRESGEKEKEKEKAALYASSLFQNSPSPDDLPPPAF